MKYSKNILKSHLSGLFRVSTDGRILEAINIENLRNTYIFSILVILLEMISLIIFIITGLNSPKYWYTVGNVSFCILVCVFAVVLSNKLILKHKESGVLSDLSSNMLVSVFYILLSAWGALTDLTHYKVGEQMLTFYIVQFCFICFVAMRPKVGTILISLSFADFYLGFFLIDGAAKIQFQNYVLFIVIAIMGNAIRFEILQGYEKSNIKITELNQILQQEAVIDELTHIKNRKALRSDMDGYLGHYVCVIMADIDHFKAYNDTYGHLIGDQVLSEVASVTIDTFGKGSAYRYGGDEFLIVIKDCSPTECTEKIREWKKSIRKIWISDIAHPVCLSDGCSCGMIVTSEEFRNSLKQADSRLYEAKKTMA